MRALLTVHETIAIDTQKQCSLLYRALLYFEEDYKVVPCCLGFLFKNKWCYLKQLKQQGTTYRTIEQRSLDLQHGSNLVAGGRECDDKTFGRLAGFDFAIAKECDAADLATIGVALAQ